MLVANLLLIRDIGECSGFNAPLVGWIASNLPGLDRSSLATFEQLMKIVCHVLVIIILVARRRTDKYKNRHIVWHRPYEQLHTIPPNATEYILHALRSRSPPSSAHTKKDQSMTAMGYSSPTNLPNRHQALLITPAQVFTRLSRHQPSDPHS
ncbi:hypothetical protein SAY86_023279 [Trapa natans]|uniref:Uncharacterized protein n=1 Tax=Trapa natans TaxID=22666 RepID=A0AAN7R5N3_TRANT|nr:hypothetical protein SAY86_023279 [Trapa natans]